MCIIWWPWHQLILSDSPPVFHSSPAGCSQGKTLQTSKPLQLQLWSKRALASPSGKFRVCYWKWLICKKEMHVDIWSCSFCCLPEAKRVSFSASSTLIESTRMYWSRIDTTLKSAVRRSVHSLRQGRRHGKTDSKFAELVGLSEKKWLHSHSWNSWPSSLGIGQFALYRPVSGPIWK